MKIITTFKNLDLIEVSSGRYCVRKRTKNIFGKPKDTFFNLNLNGTDFTFDSLVAEMTVSDFDRCEYVFNCNAIKAGSLLTKEGQK